VDPSMYTMNQQFYVPQVIPQNNMVMSQKINHMIPQQQHQMHMMQNNHHIVNKIDKGKKPKGRMSNYTFFVQMCREEHRKKHPNENVNFTEFSKKCAERWKQMTEQEKSRFGAMAASDKIRYDNEMASYTPPVGESNGQRKRKKKDPNAPKRPLSAFFLFCHDERPAVKSLYPNYSVGEAAKELGDRWNKVTAEQKAKYEAQVQADKGRYEQELAKYKAGL